MKYIVAAVIVFGFIFGISIKAEDLKKFPMDDASTIGLKIETDETVKTEGKASIKITTTLPVTICLGEVTGLNVEDSKLVFKAKIKTELEGVIFLEMWVQIGEEEYFSKGLDNVVNGKSDWKEVQTPFVLMKGQKAEKATLNIVINGKGTVWVDDVVLAKEPLK